MAVSSRGVPRSPRQRAAVTNDPRRLPGVDGRSSAGRRFIDLAEEIIAEYGDASTTAVRELAGLRFSLEATQAAVVAGDVKAREDLVRISRLIVKKEAVLRQAAQMARAKVPSLSEYLAERYPVAAAEGDDR